uniref:Growth hormone releasing hormone receptor a n=1 Tax=Sphaeramia orbicularis TaxID=375764 RepID=A0A672YE80_9TELE
MSIFHANIPLYLFTCYDWVELPRGKHINIFNNIREWPITGLWIYQVFEFCSLFVFAGCKTEWDDIGCWRRAEVGQVVNLSCSEVFQHFSSNQGYVYRNCTVDGWSEMYPPYEEACVFSDDSEPESEVHTFYLSTFRQVYTVGYATSLISLMTAIVVKFRCTRNYIHINLFSSFVLRASAVFIKDTVLFADETLDHCSMSTVRSNPARGMNL